MHCVTPNRRRLKEVEVVDFEKRRSPSKHYVYIINVSWNDGSDTVIYRRYSMFFDFQAYYSPNRDTNLLTSDLIQKSRGPQILFGATQKFTFKSHDPSDLLVMLFCGTCHEIILLETFPWEGGLKEPSARKIPFLPGKILFRRSHIRDVAQKRLKSINEYCKAIVQLPDHIAHCDHVLDFFEVRPEDLNPNRDESKRRKNDEPEISEISAPLFLEPYVAIADYLSTQHKELSITDGERIEVIEKNENGWWLVSNDEGERGWVPGVYLEKPDGTVEDLVTKRAAPGQGEKYITTQEYKAENSDEISFGAGVTVEVLQKNFEGWWLIRYNGKQGNAPAPFLEKQQSWTLPNKVEIISSIHDLKNSSNGLASGSSYSGVPASPLSPTSPTSYRGVVLPPPKRSSIKRSNKRPNAPPPLPPGLTQEPTYEYLTIAPFDASIPDGVSFGEDRKVKVVEKSPGGWWFVNVDGREGWAPATYIQKREVAKPKPPGPARPKLPTVKKSNSSVARKKDAQPPARPSAIRKGSLNSITISHPILQSTTSAPVGSGPAKRPLPPVPSSLSTENVTAQDCTYEDIKESDKTDVKSRPTNLNLTQNHSFAANEPGKVDFRNCLKPTKPPHVHHAPARPPAVHKNGNKFANTKPKSAVFAKFENNSTPGNKIPAGNASNVVKSELKKPNHVRPPSVPTKPKPPSVPNKPKFEPKPNAAGDKPVTDFRSVLRSTQNKNANSSIGKPCNVNKGPSVPKKPNNPPLKPPVSSRPNLPTKSTNADKPVLRRFQNSNNSNGKTTSDKPAFTVAHARFELKNQPDLSATLSKRGSPDGQPDFKFTGVDSEIPVSPPARTKKLLKSTKKSVGEQPLNGRDLIEKVAIAISDHAGLEAGELSFSCGDKAVVIDEAERDWWYVEIGDNAGWAPSECFEIEPVSQNANWRAHIKDNTPVVPCDGYDSVYSEIECDPDRPRFPADFVALADFEAADSSMLSLTAGDVVRVTQEAQGGWWYAIREGGRGEGWVPSTYLETA